MSKAFWGPALVAAALLSAAGCEDAGSGASRDAAAEGDSGANAGGEATDAGADDDAELAVDAGDGLQEVSIRFKAKLGDLDLACGEAYTDQGSTRVTATPQDFRFYVQEVRLVRADGSEEQVAFDDKPPFQSKDVALLDFTDGQGSCGSGGTIVNTTITGKVAAGAYEGIVFVNGVPEELNHAGPAESAVPPLDDITMFWSWLDGYRFIVAELLAVETAHGDPSVDAGDGAPDADAGHGDAGAQHGDAAAADGGGHGGGGHPASAAAFVHIGSRACSGSQRAGFRCTRQARNEVRLGGFDPARHSVIADLAEVFKTSDLQAAPQCHGVAPECAAPYAAFGIDIDTGEPIDGQQVFRVE